MNEEEFYRTVADILDTEHDYVTPALYMRRWGRRTPGNGRFPGRGLVRIFGTIIHIALYSPALHASFDTMSAALDAIRKTCQKSGAILKDAI